MKANFKQWLHSFLSHLDELGMFCGFVGGLFLIASTASAPNIGTDGGFSLVFDKPKYRFIVETDSKFLTIGIALIVFGFLLQIIHKTWEKPTQGRFIILGSCFGIAILLLKIALGL